MFIKKRLFFTLLVTCFTTVFALQNLKKDTSYTVHSAYRKYIKEFPKIEIVTSRQFSNITEIQDIPFNNIENRSLCLDAFINKKESNPAVILVHGGGWKSGNKDHMKPLAQHIASKGYSCFTVTYRLSDEAKYPAGIYDVKEAIKYIKLHAKQFHVDSSKVAVLGASSGAQMTTLVGATNNNNKFEENGTSKISSTVQAIVNLDGILAFQHPESKEGKMASLWLGGMYEEIPDVWIEASPLTHANQNTPPILFIGSQYKRFQAGREDVISILNKHNIYNQVKIISDSPHTFWLFHPWFNKTIAYITTFLDNTFKN